MACRAVCWIQGYNTVPKNRIKVINMLINKKLDSGVTLVGEKLSNFHSVTMGIWVGAGSVTETPQENGISHLIEHMLFKGTEKRSAKQIAVDVDNIGGQINAFTSKEATCYYIKTIDEKIEDGVEILTDLFCNATLDEAELEKEKGVVLEEIAMSNDTPEDVAMDLIASTFFRGCSLEKTILGPPENIRSYTRDDLKKYISRHYTADNIVVSVAGNFDEARLTEHLNSHLALGRREKSDTGFADCSGFENVKGFETVEKDIEQVHVCMGMPSYDIKSEKRFALNTLNNIIGGSMSSRLFQKIREEMGMAYTVYSHPVMYRDTGMFSLYAGTTAQNTMDVAEIMVEELSGIAENGITKTEFEQSREQLKGNLILSLESTSAKMNSIGKSMTLTGKVYTDEEVVKMVENVTMDDIDEVIKEVIDPANITATYVGKINDAEALRKVTDKG